jgi:CheY-like chemotaxis protein
MNPDLKPILLAEDNENDIELTLAALSENNLANRLVTVRNGAEVLDYLYRRGSYADAERPVVVLLDIKMPKVTGIEALRVMKSDPNLKAIPVVMLTSSRQNPDVQECYRLGANAYVVKPVDFTEFFDAIKMLGRFWGVVNETPGEEAQEVSAPTGSEG